jgi:hypothetical protein
MLSNTVVLALELVSLFSGLASAQIAGKCTGKHQLNFEILGIWVLNSPRSNLLHRLSFWKLG